ncbi:carbohydrate kinase [Marinomonas agarivorans]|nr:carbohydrate kinase [Marinomonas agarivorans]
MKPTKLIAFGEALIDFLAKKDPKTEQVSFIQYPGGAPANVAVAAAKQGVNSHFIGQVGDDRFGRFLIDCLSGYGVNTQAVRLTQEAKTALAFVTLDDDGERSFEFYRNPSADILYKADYFNETFFADNEGIFHTCSNTLTSDDITTATFAGMAMAKQFGWLISCDINLRTNLWPAHQLNQPRIIDWLDQAHVVKASLEELVLLTDDVTGFIKRLLANNTLLFILTDGANPVRYYTKVVQGEIGQGEIKKGEIKTPKVDVKDTTAAGDAFVGGLLAKLTELAPTPEKCEHMSKNQWDDVIRFAVAAGAYTVTQYGAYPALPNQEQVQSMLMKVASVQI